MKLWQRRLSFGSPDLSISLLFATVNGWLLYYLVTIVGLPPLLAGAVFVCGRILDGILDPLIGAWTDRYGRKRAIVGGLPVAALAFVGLWAVPNAFDQPVAQAAGSMAVFSVFALAYTCVSVPRLGMLPGFVPGYHGRTGQVAVDMGFVFIALLISSTAFPAAIAYFSAGEMLSASSPDIWIGMAGAIALLAVCAYLPFILFVKEPPSRVSTKHPGVFATVRALADTRGAVPTIALFGCTVMALVTLQSILPFWLEDGPGIDAAGQTVVLLLVFLATLASLPLWALCARRYGKSGGLRLGIFAFLIALLLAASIPQGAGLGAQLALSAILAGGGAGALSLFPWSMVPDVAEAHARRLAASVEGAATAGFTMTNKAAAAAALMLNALLLEALPHFPTESELTIAAKLALPAVFALAALALCAFTDKLSPSVTT